MAKIPTSERALLFAIGDKLADNVTPPHVTGLLHKEVMTEVSNDDRDVITELVEGSKPGDFEGAHANVALAIARVSGIIRNHFSSRAPKKRPDLVVSGPESGWLAKGVSKATAIDHLVLEKQDDGGLVVPTNATAGLYGNRKRVVVVGGVLGFNTEMRRVLWNPYVSGRAIGSVALVKRDLPEFKDTRAVISSAAGFV